MSNELNLFFYNVKLFLDDIKMLIIEAYNGDRWKSFALIAMIVSPSLLGIYRQILHVCVCVCARLGMCVCVLIL